MTREIKTQTLQAGDAIYAGPSNDAEPYLVTAELIAEIIKEMPGASMIIVRSLNDEVFNDSKFPIDHQVFYTHKPR